MSTSYSTVPLYEYCSVQYAYSYSASDMAVGHLWVTCGCLRWVMLGDARVPGTPTGELLVQ